jgi:hypothetical protein
VGGHSRGNFQPAVVVAVRDIEVMEMAIHEIVDVIAMGHCFVTTVFAMLVGFLVARATVVRRTFVRIRRCHLNAVIVDVVAVNMMKVAIMQVIGVVIVFHCRMTTTGAMLVVMGSRMLGVRLRHIFSFLVPHSLPGRLGN